MIQAIKRQIQAQWKDYVVCWLVVMISYAVGVALMLMIPRLAGDSKMWVTLGTMLGGGVALMYLLIMSALSVGVDFNLEVSMGCTRKHFFWSHCIVILGSNVVVVLMLLVMCAGEEQLYRNVYPELSGGLAVMPFLLRWAFLLLLLVTVAGSFCGALVMRFGMRAFWFLWTLWMAVFLVGPRILDAVEDTPDSLFGRLGAVIGGWVTGVPEVLWAVLAVITVIACFAGSWGILRRQQVTR